MVLELFAFNWYCTFYFKFTCSLLVHRKGMGSMLTLYPATLPVTLVTGVFNRSFQIFYIDNHGMCKQKQFNFVPSNLYTFYFFFFFCLIALAGTSTTMLIRNSEKEHSSLVPDGSRKASSI